MTDEPPFSRPFRVDALPAEGLIQTIEARADERAALAALNRLPAIASLVATFAVRRSGRGGVHVTGKVHAELTQLCVVSLEPFAATVDEPIDVRFAPVVEARAARRGGKDVAEEVVEIGDEDPPDPIVDGRIDLGAAAAEYFALGLDPYPRKPGVAFNPPEDAQGGEESPFAALAKAKEKP
jgi:hypothetical protein